MRSILITLLALPFLLLSGCLDSVDPYDDTEDLLFLEEYSQQENVITTESGLMYRMIEEGHLNKPGPEDIILFDIKGEHVVTGEIDLDSSQFDHSVLVPIDFMAPGLFEAIQYMNIGAKYEFVIPSDLLGGDGKVFKYEVELHNTQENLLAENSQKEEVTVTESGLQYRVITEGEGEKPGENSTVQANYEGTLLNGREFDSRESVTFDLGGTNPPIQGFSEGLQLMSPGATYEFIIPPDIAYGDDSPGYPGAALRFKVDLLEVL